MNALATKYAWKCSHVVDGTEQITIAVKLFLLAVAYRIPKRTRYETEPTTLAMLAEMTGISDRHLRSIRELLVRLGELQEGGAEAPVRTGRQDDKAPPWPKRAVYRLPGIAGPLFLMTPWDVDASDSATSAGFLQPKSAASAEFDEPKSATSAVFRRSNAATSSEFARRSRHSVPRFGAVSGDGRTSEAVRTNHHDDERQEVAVSLAAAHAFLDRWCREYPAHNGSDYTPDVDSELPIILELLKDRSADRLWAMALALWSCTVDQDDWIPTTDRSIRVLRKAQNTLGRLVAKASSRPAGRREEPCRYKHQPPCLNNVVCAERERQRLAAEDAAAEAVG